MSHGVVPRDVLRIAGEHAGELADILRAVRLEHRAELLDVFAEALVDAADGRDIDWDDLLTELHERETAPQRPGEQR